VARNRHDAAAHYHRGLVLYKLGRYQEAVDNYNIALAQDRIGLIHLVLLLALSVAKISENLPTKIIFMTPEKLIFALIIMSLVMLKRGEMLILL
jgi:tetratricopeptide (TPR) repeat protein